MEKKTCGNCMWSAYLFSTCSEPKYDTNIYLGCRNTGWSYSGKAPSESIGGNMATINGLENVHLSTTAACPAWVDEEGEECPTTEK